MSRIVRRQRALGLPSPHFTASGRCGGFEGPPGGDVMRSLPRFPWRALMLAAEVRNGVRWPWLDPRDVMRELRGRQSLARAYGDDLAKRWRRRGDARRWLEALRLTPRERAELLAYLTRGYP